MSLSRNPFDAADAEARSAHALERLALNAGCVALIAACATASVVIYVGSKAALRRATPWAPRRLASARSARARPPIA